MGCHLGLGTAGVTAIRAAEFGSDPLCAVLLWVFFPTVFNVDARLGKSGGGGGGGG